MSCPDFDIKKIREDFPALQTLIHGKPLTYLDNAATTLKPHIVAETIRTIYLQGLSNVHRSVHYLGEQTTKIFESTRNIVKDFINAADPSEIIFTKGTTDSINLIAYSFGEAFINAGDEILITEMEHHSNIVPWQELCKRKNAVLKFIPINDDGELILDDLDQLLSTKTKLISLVHTSNSLGTINPIKTIIDAAHKKNIPVLIDAAQAIAHQPINVQELDCDFLTFSAHKMYGPTGVGILYGKKKWLEKLPPYQTGGDMIETVSMTKTTFAKIPHKFEAGTPNIVGVIGLGITIHFIKNISYDAIIKHETELLQYATEQLEHIEYLKIIGKAKEKAGIISFIIEGIHAHDLGTLVDSEGVAIRTGHHCTQPIMQHFNIPATARISFAIYNTKKDIDAAIHAIEKAKVTFGV